MPAQKSTDMLIGGAFRQITATPLVMPKRRASALTPLGVLTERWKNRRRMGMDRMKVVAVVVILILAVAFCLLSFHRTAQLNSEMKDLNEHLRQVAGHLDRIATSLEQAQLLRPAPVPQQPGRR